MVVILDDFSKFHCSIRQDGPVSMQALWLQHKEHYIFSGKTVLLIKLHKNFSSSFSQGIPIHLAEGRFHQNFENVQVTISKKVLTDTCEAWEKILNPSWLPPLLHINQIYQEHCPHSPCSDIRLNI